MQDNKQIIATLTELPKEERGYLLRGQLEKLPELLERKSALVAELEATPNPANLSNLHDQLIRNHTLLNSAMEGIQRVSNRLDTLKRLRGSLETYDSTGQKSAICTDEIRQVEKRA